MADPKRPDCRLYLLTPDGLGGAAGLEAFAEQLAAALAVGDIACVLLRTEGLDDAQALTAARRLAPVAQDQGAAFLVEDRPVAARDGGADGVHASLAGAPVARLREAVGPEAIVGVGCGLSRHAAMVAAEAGADYVAFAGEAPGLAELLAWWQATMTPPCVAMGGIMLDDAPELARAGADFLAVGDVVWAHPDGPAAAVAAFAARLAGTGG